jgi:hypothetical protein
MAWWDDSDPEQRRFLRKVPDRTELILYIILLNCGLVAILAAVALVLFSN